MSIQLLLLSGLVAIFGTVLVLSTILLFDWLQRKRRANAYHRLIHRKMALLERLHQEVFAQEPLLSKVFQPNFGQTTEVKL